MESHSNLPPVTGPNLHITNAAVNNDAQLNHPPDSEMNTAAIVAMKERGGSSRQAIAKYLESECKNLSPSHATLLTQQLKKMKNQGQLVMNKHSYMLSDSGNSQSFAKGSVVKKRRAGRPPKIPCNGGGVGGVASPAVSCVSGLPVIAAPSVMIGAVPMVVPMGKVDGGPVKRRPGGPPTLHTVVAEAEPGAGAEAVSVGRRLGRPPTDNNGIVGVGTEEGGTVLGKRRRGRVVMEASMVSVLVGNSDGVGWGCGRPHKNVSVSSSGHSDGGSVFMPVEGMGGAGRASIIEERKPKQSKVKHVADIIRPYLNNEVAPIALEGLQEVGGIALMCAPVSRGALSGEGAAVTGIIGAPSSDQDRPGSDPVEPLCAQYRNLRI